MTKRPFKKHGRWRSESAKDGYVNDSGCHGVHQANAGTNVGHRVGWVAITMLGMQWEI